MGAYIIHSANQGFRNPTNWIQVPLQPENKQAFTDYRQASPTTADYCFQTGSRQIGGASSFLNVDWQIPQRQETLFGGTHARKVISGITKDSTGAILGSCTVKVYGTTDDIEVDSAVSDAVTGAYAVGVPTSGNYYIVAYKAGSPDVAGTTVNTLTGS